MKKITLLALTAFSAIHGFNQSVLYFNFVTHNEETLSWDNPPYYTNNRARLVTLADYFQANGITWNFQSDWTYLNNIFIQETPGVTATTNNKNILRWLSEDRGVEIDPHGHETQYIYPDIAKLLDSAGVVESKIMGGTIYDGMNGINVWTNMSNGQYGVIFPGHFWQPDYLWGAGTPNHANDPKYFGVWNPQDTINFLAHDTAQHIRCLSTGCEIKIKDTSAVINVVNQIKEVIEHVEDLTYPANGFYMQTIFFEQGELNNMLFYDKVIEIADSVNQLVLTGHGQWKTLKQMYTEWETTYAAQMFMWECGDIVGIEESANNTEMKIYPNPVIDQMQIEMGQYAPGHTIEIYNLFGETVHRSALLTQVSSIDLSDYSAGIYFYYIKTGQQILSQGKVIKQ